jgi:hypothetical protein
LASVLTGLKLFGIKVGILLRQGGLQEQLSDVNNRQFTLYSVSQNSADNMAVYKLANKDGNSSDE